MIWPEAQCHSHGWPIKHTTFGLFTGFVDKKTYREYLQPYPFKECLYRELLYYCIRKIVHVQHFTQKICSVFDQFQNKHTTLWRCSRGDWYMIVLLVQLYYNDGVGYVLKKGPHANSLRDRGARREKSYDHTKPCGEKEKEELLLLKSSRDRAQYTLNLLHCHEKRSLVVI